MAPVPYSIRTERCRKGDKALLISLQYDNPVCEPVKPLKTPHRDALQLKNFLLKERYLEGNITQMSDNAADPNMLPTKTNVVRVLLGCHLGCDLFYIEAS